MSIEITINRTCRICLEDTEQDDIFRPCICQSYVHRECLNKWRETDNRYKNQCEICLYEYKYTHTPIVNSRIYRWYNVNFGFKYFMQNALLYIYGGLIILTDLDYKLAGKFMDSRDMLDILRVYYMIIYIITGLTSCPLLLLD